MFILEKSRTRKETVKGFWNSHEVHGSGMLILKEKLKWLKQDLKTWNKEAFRDLNRKKQKMIADISILRQKTTRFR